MLAIAPEDPTEARESPHDFAAERSVLGAILLAPLLFSDLRGQLVTDEFFLPAHREVWDAMGAVAGRGHPIDPVMLADELKARGMLSRLEGGESYLNALANAASIPDVVGHHVGLVKEKATARRLIAACAGAMARAYGGATMDDLLPEVRRQIMAIDASDTNAGPVKMADAIDAAIEHIDAKSRNPNAYQIQSGLADFDRTIGGVGRAGQLVIVAAQPGQGKTSFAENVALHNGSRGVPVLIFSLEMLRQELIERALSGETGIDGRKIVAGILKQADWEAINPAAGRLRQMPVWIDERRTLTADRICSEARRWRERFARSGADDRALVVIDYLGLVRSAERSQNREREVAGMTRAFKGLAGDLGCPVMLVSQLSRDSAKQARRPILSDLRDSGAIEADADMVIVPWRDPPVGDEARNPPEVQSATIIVAKHRNGPIGEVDVKWRPSTTQFLDNDFERWTGRNHGPHFTETDDDR